MSPLARTTGFGRRFFRSSSRKPATLLAFRGAPREVGEVSAHPRFRTVDEATGLKVFVGIRVETSSPDTLLKNVEILADWVGAAERDASGAVVSGEWDVVHESSSSWVTTACT